MANEEQMRGAMQGYIDGFNQADLEAIVGLYADDATVEDPVGSPVKSGKAAIREFYRESLKTGATLELSAPIRTSHSNSAAMAFIVSLQLPEQGHVRIHVIDVMTFNEAGEFTSMQAYWGPGDMEQVDGGQ